MTHTPELLYAVLRPSGAPTTPAIYRSRPEAERARDRLNATHHGHGSYYLYAYGVREVKPDLVGVIFRNFDTPSEAARAANGGTDTVFTYGADPELRLTVGDRVRVPVGDRHSDYDERVATVVELDATQVVDYLKMVKGRSPVTVDDFEDFR